MTKGFATLIILLIVPLVLVALFFTLTKTSLSPAGKQTALLQTLDKVKEDVAKINQANSAVSWEFGYDSKEWSPVGNPPECPEPFTFPSPFDLQLASGLLYPGQPRGGDYKAHGGARFDGLANNEVEVRAPFDASVFMAARHTQGKEVQYVLYFINDCGMAYKLDHMLELTEKFNTIMESVPLAGDTDTRTTGISPKVFVAKGELIATKVGLLGNVFVDFGVYDFRKRNGVDYSGRNIYNVEQFGMHGVCWLAYLEEPDKTLAKSLPGADGASGKTSDYCK